MTERQLSIILAVVYEYIKTGEPAGSRTIVKKYIKGLSPATIRNEMADLEELGYFYQPHTSSGRLPTARAYRVYVDSVTARARSHSHEEDIKRELLGSKSGIEELLNHVTHLMARLTNCVAVAAVPTLDDAEIRHIDLMLMGGSNVLALIVLKGGLVHHSQFNLPYDIDADTLEELTRRINTVASGHSWSEVREALYQYVLNGLEETELSCQEAIGALDKFLTEQNYKFFSSGARQILNMPHFQALSKLQAVLNILEQEKPLANMIEKCRKSSALKISLGAENETEGMEENAMILIPARPRQQKAVLGLIGPLRMDYEKSISVLESVADALNEDKV
ncbi:MAG: heat-inducible transcriptional repressor HrcA [Synergistales bacterium]|nr:heat-inducible transcriptional repressor HrcA [Synergistales bacterium]MDY6401836.1 heat-inducible transcriptional repressor HrcA [Synergistales bacterium]MDY6403850.1 heat-inducible transcriptional repressor HrcA [Synergistales bacterium]MDY6409928.1 heat-inducible transcriptional repressor HrcA [Synergistales bacterium]MDY6415190.1 heat-inducible transcriptional repressor HrcA [Synergistales bacterium]